jgi:hypothetical protein
MEGRQVGVLAPRTQTQKNVEHTHEESRFVQSRRTAREASATRCPYLLRGDGSDGEYNIDGGWRAGVGRERGLSATCAAAIPAKVKGLLCA